MVDPDEFDSLNRCAAPELRARQHAARKSHAGRLADPDFHLVDPADLARESHLAEDDRFRIDGPVEEARGDCRRDFNGAPLAPTVSRRGLIRIRGLSR